MDECRRNRKVAEQLDIWEWCSRSLHVKWRRRTKHRNGILMAIGYAVSDSSFVSPFELSKVYKGRSEPLLDRKRVLSLWKAQPVPLLEMCWGAYTRRSSLTAALEQIRLGEQNNQILDKIYKKMRAREERFGPEWYFQGHQPQGDCRTLREGTTRLRAKIRTLLAKNHKAVDEIAREVLSQGGWQFGKLPVASFIRKTPELLLNRVNRVKLWQAAQDVIAREMGEEERLEKLCAVLYSKITPSLRDSIEAQGYTVDQVIDDMLNFDMYKGRTEVV